MRTTLINGRGRLIMGRCQISRTPVPESTVGKLALCVSICLASYRGSSFLTGAVNNLQGMLYYASYNCPCMSGSCHIDLHEHMHKPKDYKMGETFHK